MYKQYSTPYANDKLKAFLGEFLDFGPRCWAKAFHEVLGVGPEFYINASPYRRSYLERHYTELASHDTRKGRRAAKVVAKRVEYSLEDNTSPVDTAWGDAWISKGLQTGRRKGHPNGGPNQGWLKYFTQTWANGVSGVSGRDLIIDEFMAFAPKGDDQP